jgi:hypothetical protein
MTNYSLKKKVKIAVSLADKAGIKLGALLPIVKRFIMQAFRITHSPTRPLEFRLCELNYCLFSPLTDFSFLNPKFSALASENSKQLAKLVYTPGHVCLAKLVYTHEHVCSATLHVQTYLCSQTL